MQGGESNKEDSSLIPHFVSRLLPGGRSGDERKGPVHQTSFYSQQHMSSQKKQARRQSELNSRSLGGENSSAPQQVIPESPGPVSGTNSQDGVRMAMALAQPPSVKPQVQKQANIEQDSEWLVETATWDKYYNAEQAGRVSGIVDPDTAANEFAAKITAPVKTYDDSVRIAAPQADQTDEIRGAAPTWETKNQYRVSMFLASGNGSKVAPMPDSAEAAAKKIQQEYQAREERKAKELHWVIFYIKFYLFEYVILPHDKFAVFWEPWIVICVIWNAVLLPYNLAFGAETEENSDSFVYIFDHIADWMFVIDLFRNFATAYIDDWGSLVTSRRDISREYLKYWFWVDLPATLPFELFVPKQQATAINMVKCIRLIRVTKILKFIERFRFANSARIIRLFASLMLVCHWIGCLWYFIGQNTRTPCATFPFLFDPTVMDVKVGQEWFNFNGEPIPAGATPLCSWLSLQRLGLASTPIHTKYLRSVYWAVTTITSVGYGDIVPVTDGETCFTIFNMLLGAGVYAMIFSNFVSYIARIDQASTKYSEKMEDIRGQMRYLRLPEGVQEKVEQYFEYVWLCHKGLLERDNYFFDELPLPLHLECAEYLHMETVRKNPLFTSCSKSFLRGVLVRLKPQLVVPEEYVINKGDAATAMYFISRGELEVLTDTDGQHLAILKAGGYFGDIGVLTKRMRTASIRAITFCDLHYLVADELRELLFVYEEDAERLSQNALDFVKKFEQPNLYAGMKKDLQSGRLEGLSSLREDAGSEKSPASPTSPVYDEGPMSATTTDRVGTERSIASFLKEEKETAAIVKTQTKSKDTQFLGGKRDSKKP